MLCLRLTRGRKKSNLQVYTFESAKVRTVSINGQPWFVATDVCRCLGLQLTAGAGSHLRRLNADERAVQQVTHTPNQGGLTTTSKTTIISESGLYKLILRCDKPEAKRFTDWVTRDVLPAIRKDGGYVMGGGGP